jgi:hypothetical protein
MPKYRITVEETPAACVDAGKGWGVPVTRVAEREADDELNAVLQLGGDLYHPALNRFRVIKCEAVG